MSRLLPWAGLAVAAVAVTAGLSAASTASTQPMPAAHAAPLPAITVCTGVQVLDDVTGTCVTPTSTVVPTPPVCPPREVFDRYLGRCEEPRDRDRYWNRRDDILIPETSTKTSTNDAGQTCTTVTTTLRNYRTSVDRWNDLTGRYHDGHLSEDQRRELDRAYWDRTNWYDRYNRDRSVVLNKDTHCDAPPVQNLNITVNPAPPSYSAPAQVGRVPTGATPAGSW